MSECGIDQWANRLVFGALLFLVLLAGVAKIFYNRHRYFIPSRFLTAKKSWDARRD